MIIGIDLGTTNSTLSFIDERQDACLIEKFPILQTVADGITKEIFFLPSFYYFPLPEENKEPFVGFYAEKRGRELPDRVIMSAKSWACHPTIDKRVPFLPLSDLEEKRSPLQVLSALLAYLKKSWEMAFTDLPFSEQKIFITVPASFDPAARSLIQEAAKCACYPEVTLMEEPLAAFYAWLARHEKNWRSQLKVDDVVLVVDIGGGTTDFSLISVEENEGNLCLERKAVGDHLLLGGDNIDLALAYFAQEKLGTELDFIQFQSLIMRCREAKEELLGGKNLTSFEIVLQGRGSKILGGSQTVKFTKEEVEKILVEGFFPEVSLTESPLEEKSTSLMELGLPFVKDPRVTVQLASFLSRSRVLPNKVLFNGGTMKASNFQHRLLSQLKKWKGADVCLLEEADLDFAVSMGAAYYGWSKEKKKIRVRAGISKNYFIGVESAGLAVPGIKPQVKAICIAPLGMEEGTEQFLETQKFSLMLEKAAKFRFFSSDSSHVSFGDKLSLKDVRELKPVETVLDKKKPGEEMAAVRLQTKITELGTLELWCVSDSGEKWKLEFDVRKDVLARSEK